MVKKKENVADLSVEEKLQNLYQLQCILSEIDKIKTLRGELPLEVEDLEDEIVGLQTRIEKNKDEIVNLRTKANDLKAKIEEALIKLNGYKEHLNNVANNREYDLLNKEIEFQNLEIELCQKRSREAESMIKAKEEILARSEEALENRNQDLDIKKNELDEIIAETKAEEEKLREKTKSLELSIEPRRLLSFKRIRKNTRNGLGIVPVLRDACGGCFAKIPPQRQLDVRMRKKFIVCEYCGRILIDPDLAGIKTDASHEEEPKRRRGIRRKKTEEQ